MSDEYYDRAVDLAREKGGCSVSLLQRRFQIGYSRASSLIDELERDGILGPMPSHTCIRPFIEPKG